MKKGIYKKCFCGKEIYVFPSRIGAKFCSIKCSNQSKINKEYLNCDQCGIKIERRPSEKRNPYNFCSQKCYGKKNSLEAFGLEKVTPKSEVGRHGKRMRNGLWSTKKSDLEFSRYIRNRDLWTCFFCRKVYPPNSQGMQNSHFWGRRASSTRFDPENCDSACASCHFKHEGNKQGLYRELKLKQLGQVKYSLLMQKYYKIVKREAAIKELMAWII